MERRKTRQIQLGNVKIGGGAPVAVQSMTNTHTDDAAATLAQINRLAEAGCDIVRCAVPDMAAAEGLKEIVKKSPIPVIADIHFDYKLALAAVDAGVSGLRLNPGNIGGEDKVRAVVEAVKPLNIPIRIGVNAGSLPKDLLEKYGHPTPEALVEAAWRHIRILESMDYRNIKISLKAHDVPLTIAAYRLLASQCDYPLHVGITEAGTINSGIIKSAVGIGTLLAEGIGLAVVGQVHDGFCAELQRHPHLVQLNLVVLCVPGDAQIHVDLGSQALADALGTQGLVVDVGGNGDLAQGHPLPNDLRVCVFFLCHRFHFRGNDPLLGGVHLRCILSHGASILSSKDAQAKNH